MLRNTIINDFYNTIDNHGKFTNAEFAVDSKIKNDEAVDVSITFLADPQYRINFYVQTVAAKEVQDTGDMNPGKVMQREGFYFDGITNVDIVIKKWLDNLWQEVSTASSFRKTQEREKLVNEFISKFGPLTDEHFTEYEEIKVESYLDIVEGKLKEMLEKSAKDKVELEAKLERLHKDFETLKQSIPVYKKKGWVRNYGTKVVKWMLDSDNRKLLENTYDFIIGFLPENVQQQLP